MSRKTKEEAEKTRSRILSNALALFVKRGYEHTTFNDIAAKLKMTKGAIYWHFPSKKDLLKALLSEALDRFSAALAEKMQGREITFPAVAEMLVQMAERITTDRRRSEFFMLMNVGLKWTDAELAQLAKSFIEERSDGPYMAVLNALNADVEARRVKVGVNPDEIASSVMAIWDGIIKRKIEGFLVSDMSLTLKHAYDSLWNGIKV
ncbi:MAG: TetR family transcriptional regulator [Kiritimatiellae bacterium]|nr:TetR family transcriptional regulator [Kiritimatiellia bacterium]